jgi:hypothetical protein
MPKAFCLVRATIDQEVDMNHDHDTEAENQNRIPAAADPPAQVQADQRLSEEGEFGGGKEPLPDVFAGGVLVFLFELAGQENPSIAFGQVPSVETADFVHLLADFLQGTGGQGHGSVFLAFAIVDGQEHGLEIETMNTEVDAFG